MDARCTRCLPVGHCYLETREGSGDLDVLTTNQCIHSRGSLTVGYDSAQHWTSHPPQPTSSSPLRPTRLPSGYFRLPLKSVCIPLCHDEEIQGQSTQRGTGIGDPGTKLTVSLLCKSEPVPSKKFPAVVAGAERFLGPVFTWASEIR